MPAPAGGQGVVLKQTKTLEAQYSYTGLANRAHSASVCRDCRTYDEQVLIPLCSAGGVVAPDSFGSRADVTKLSTSGQNSRVSRNGPLRLVFQLAKEPFTGQLCALRSARDQEGSRLIISYFEKHLKQSIVRIALRSTSAKLTRRSKFIALN